VRFQKVPKQLLVAAGLLAVPVTIQFEQAANALPVYKPKVDSESEDIRTARLRQFFNTLHCPIQAADDNRLDWRLLPSISVIESGGGKIFRNNNLFGWDNGDTPFPTVRAGIHQVANKLGRSLLYRNVDSLGKLRFYNPNPDYAVKVVEVMDTISPSRNMVPIHMNRRGTVLMSVN
jgi:hypothetical protein